jgi:hypothetical protein
MNRGYVRSSGLSNDENLPMAVRIENMRKIDDLRERRAYLYDVLDIAGCPNLTIIDGIGDFVSDVNKSDECLELVYRLLRITSERDTGILCTLHQNPTDFTNGKPRGVLGSELWRKCESVIHIEKVKNSDIRCITTDFALGKVRSANDRNTVYFQWDDTAGMFMTCGAPQTDGKKGATISLKMQILGKLIEKPVWSHTELINLISAIKKPATDKNYSESTAKRYVDSLKAENSIFKNKDGTYTVLKPENG